MERLNGFYLEQIQRIKFGLEDINKKLDQLVNRTITIEEYNEFCKERFSMQIPIPDSKGKKLDGVFSVRIIDGYEILMRDVNYNHPVFVNKEEEKMILYAISLLEPKMQDVIKYRYGILCDPLSNREIACRLNINDSYIIDKYVEMAIQKLRDIMSNDIKLIDGLYPLTDDPVLKKVEEFDTSISMKWLSFRSTNGLASKGITDINQLCKLSLDDIGECKGIGTKSVNEIALKMLIKFGVVLKSGSKYKYKVLSVPNKYLEVYKAL